MISGLRHGRSKLSAGGADGSGAKDGPNDLSNKDGLEDKPKWLQAIRPFRPDPAKRLPDKVQDSMERDLLGQRETSRVDPYAFLKQILAARPSPTIRTGAHPDLIMRYWANCSSLSAPRLGDGPPSKVENPSKAIPVDPVTGRGLPGPKQEGGREVVRTSGDIAGSAYFQSLFGLLQKNFPSRLAGGANSKIELDLSSLRRFKKPLDAATGAKPKE